MPRSGGAILRAQALLGRRIRDALNRALRADRVFLDVDRQARAAYEARIAPAEAGDAARVAGGEGRRAARIPERAG